MKKSTPYLILTVIWALGAWAWAANVMRYARAGTMNGFHIVTVIASVVCCILNLVIYFQLRKEKK